MTSSSTLSRIPSADVSVGIGSASDGIFDGIAVSVGCASTTVGVSVGASAIGVWVEVGAISVGVEVAVSVATSVAVGSGVTVFVAVGTRVGSSAVPMILRNVAVANPP